MVAVVSALAQTAFLHHPHHFLSSNKTKRPIGMFKRKCKSNSVESRYEDVEASSKRSTISMDRVENRGVPALKTLKSAGLNEMAVSGKEFRDACSRVKY